MTKGVRTAKATDRSKLGVEEAKRIDNLEMRMARHEQELRATDARVAALEREARPGKARYGGARYGDAGRGEARPPAGFARRVMYVLRMEPA